MLKQRKLRLIFLIYLNALTRGKMLKNKHKSLQYLPLPILSQINSEQNHYAGIKEEDRK